MDTLGLLLKLILDKPSQQEAKKGLEEIAQATDKTRRSIDQLNKSEKSNKATISELEDEYESLIDELKRLDKQLDITERKVREWKGLANEIGQVSQSLFFAGSTILGSLFLAANAETKRIQDAGVAVDATTKRWLTSQERIQLSYQRIGRTAQVALLPLLENVAALAEKGSKFVAQNPDLVRAAVNTGAVLATIGAVGLLVSKGIRFIADITLITAQANYALSTNIFKSSVDRFLAGVSAQRGIAATSSASNVAGLAGKAAITLGTVTLIATSLIIGAEVGKLIGNAIAQKIYGESYKEQNLGDTAQTYSRYIQLPGLATALALKEAGIISDEAAKKISSFSTGIDEFVGDLFNADNALDSLTDGLDDIADSSNRIADAEGFAIIRDLEEENLRAEEEYLQEREELLRRSNEILSDANDELRRANERIASNLNETLSDLAENFAEANANAEARYQERRADIIRSGNEAIVKLEQDKQEQLRKLDEDYALQRDELTRSRDALGLVKAERERDRRREEIERDTQLQIQERRRQTQIQLAEARRAFERERAERREQYEQSVADAKERAERERAEALAAYQQKVAEERKRREEELAELQRQFNEERIKRINNAYDQIRDLDGALRAERELRNRYYDILYQDLNQTLIAWSNLVQSSASLGVQGGLTPSYDMGGYTGNEIARVHAGEFVMQPSTVRMAEAMIGSRLTQQSLQSAFAGGGSAFTLNDARRFDSRIPIEDRRAIEAEASDMALYEFETLMKKRARRR